MAKKKTDALEEYNLYLDDIQEKGMEHTKKWGSMWQENLRYFLSHQLADKKQHKDWDWIIINYIWPSIMQEIAKLSKNHPKIIANPWEDSDADAADVWQSHLQWMWEKGLNRRGMRIAQIRAILDGKLFGYRVSKVYWEDKVDWDDQKKQWIGDVKYRLWHPGLFWADGGEFIDDGNCGTLRYVSLKWAKSRWPQHAKQLEEEAKDYTGTENQGWGGARNIKGQYAAPGTTAGTGDSDKGVERTDDKLLNLVLSQDAMTKEERPDKDDKVIEISELFIKDYKEVNKKEEDDVPPQQLIASGAGYMEDGIVMDAKTKQPMQPRDWPQMTVREWDEPLYPNGRHIIRAGHVILNPDYEQQKWAYPKWPFIVQPHYLLPHMWQGSDAVQLYKTAQDMVNVTVSHLTNNMACYGDPKIAVETGALEQNPRTKKAFKIGKGPGAIIRLVKNAIKNRRFEIIPPAPISGQALTLYGLFAQEYKNLSGMQDIAQGKKSSGEMSATESQWLALSANDRIQLQSVFEDEWIKGVCECIANLCQDYYEPERWIRIVGEDKVMGVQQITQKMKLAKFDVDILPSTTLPYDEDKRIARHIQAYELLAQPVPNPMLPQLLRDLEVVGWRKLLQEHTMWIKFTQFLKLYEAVKTGEITPEQAVQMLIKSAMQEFQQGRQSIEGVAAANKEKEQLDKGRERIKGEGIKEGQQKERDRQQAKDEAKREAKSKKS